MTFVVMIFSFLCAALVQNLLPGWAALGGAQVPLLMSCVMYYSLSRETGTALTAGLLAGLAQDASGQVPLGCSSLVLCVIALVLGRYKDVLTGDSPVTAAFAGATGGALMSLALSLFLSKEHLIDPAPVWVLLKVAGTGVLGLICTPIVFPVILALDRLVGNVAARKESIGEFKLP